MSGSRAVQGWALCVLGVGVVVFAAAAVVAWKGVGIVNRQAERNRGRRDLIQSLDPEFREFELDQASMGVLLGQAEEAGKFPAGDWFSEKSSEHGLPAPEVTVREIPVEVNYRPLAEVDVRWRNAVPEGFSDVLRQAESLKPYLRLRSAEIHGLPDNRADIHAVFVTVGARE